MIGGQGSLVTFRDESSRSRLDANASVLLAVEADGLLLLLAVLEEAGAETSDVFCLRFFGAL